MYWVYVLLHVLGIDIIDTWYNVIISYQISCHIVSNDIKSYPIHLCLNKKSIKFVKLFHAESRSWENEVLNGEWSNFVGQIGFSFDKIYGYLPLGPYKASFEERHLNFVVPGYQIML